MGSPPPSEIPQPQGSWQQGSLIQLRITALTDQGEGLGFFQDHPVRIPNSVPGDHLWVRLQRINRHQGWGAIHTLLTPSPDRIRPACIVADKCGGCQWQVVSYPLQVDSKAQQVRTALDPWRTTAQETPILAAEQPLRYRNKVTYPVVRRSPDAPIRMGYYEANSHHLINLNQCPVQDERMDPLLRGLKGDLQTAGWSVYDETTHCGQIRSLGLRVGRRSAEILLTLVVTDPDLPGIEDWALRWMHHYPQVVGVCVNINPERTNTLFGSQTQVIRGQGTLTEIFAGLTFSLDSTSFFQVNSEQAERLFLWIREQLALSGSETVVDAYCGIGTLTLPLAQRAKWVYGIETSLAATTQAEANARRNGIANVSFRTGTVEDHLPRLPKADLVVLDPPRKGCTNEVLQTLLNQRPARIVYISCHPGSLSRDLKILSQGYQLKQWRAADFFPQTSHVETVVFLEA